MGTVSGQPISYISDYRLDDSVFLLKLLNIQPGWEFEVMKRLDERVAQAWSGSAQEARDDQPRIAHLICLGDYDVLTIIRQDGVYRNEFTYLAEGHTGIGQPMDIGRYLLHSSNLFGYGFRFGDTKDAAHDSAGERHVAGQPESYGPSPSLTDRVNKWLDEMKRSGHDAESREAARAALDTELTLNLGKDLLCESPPRFCLLSLMKVNHDVFAGRQTQQNSGPHQLPLLNWEIARHAAETKAELLGQDKSRYRQLKLRILNSPALYERVFFMLGDDLNMLVDFHLRTRLWDLDKTSLFMKSHSILAINGAHFNYGNENQDQRGLFHLQTRLLHADDSVDGEWMLRGPQASGSEGRGAESGGSIHMPCIVYDTDHERGGMKADEEHKYAQSSLALPAREALKLKAGDLEVAALKLSTAVGENHLIPRFIGLVEGRAAADDSQHEDPWLSNGTPVRFIPEVPAWAYLQRKEPQEGEKRPPVKINYLLGEKDALMRISLDALTRSGGRGQHRELKLGELIAGVLSLRLCTRHMRLYPPQQEGTAAMQPASDRKAPDAGGRALPVRNSALELMPAISAVESGDQHLRGSGAGGFSHPEGESGTLHFIIPAVDVSESVSSGQQPPDQRVPDSYALALARFTNTIQQYNSIICDEVKRDLIRDMWRFYRVVPKIVANDLEYYDSEVRQATSLMQRGEEAGHDAAGALWRQRSARRRQGNLMRVVLPRLLDSIDWGLRQRFEGNYPIAVDYITGERGPTQRGGLQMALIASSVFMREFVDRAVASLLSEEGRLWQHIDQTGGARGLGSEGYKNALPRDDLRHWSGFMTFGMSTNFALLNYQVVNFPLATVFNPHQWLLGLHEGGHLILSLLKKHVPDFFRKRIAEFLSEHLCIGEGSFEQLEEERAIHEIFAEMFAFVYGHGCSWDSYLESWPYLVAAWQTGPFRLFDLRQYFLRGYFVYACNEVLKSLEKPPADSNTGDLSAKMRSGVHSRLKAMDQCIARKLGEHQKRAGGLYFSFNADTDGDSVLGDEEFVVLRDEIEARLPLFDLICDVLPFAMLGRNIHGTSMQGEDPGWFTGMRKKYGEVLKGRIVNLEMQTSNGKPTEDAWPRYPAVPPDSLSAIEALRFIAAWHKKERPGPDATEEARIKWRRERLRVLLATMSSLHRRFFIDPRYLEAKEHLEPVRLQFTPSGINGGQD